MQTSNKNCINVGTICSIVLFLFFTNMLMLPLDSHAEKQGDGKPVHVNGFGDVKTLDDNVLKFRDDIDSKIRDKLQTTYYYTIHSDWIELMDEHSTDLSGNVLFPNIDYSLLRPFYPGLFELIRRDKNYESYMGIVSADGTIIIPIKYFSIRLYENGIITCTGYDNSTDVYTYEGRKVCSLPPVTKNQFVFTKYNKDYQVLECCVKEQYASVSKYMLYYMDGTLVTEPFEAKIMNFHGSYIDNGIVGTTSYKRIDIADYSPQVHSEPFFDTKKFILPIRESIVNNRWVKNAVKNCDEKKWEEALFDIYYFDKYEYCYYMQNVPECMLIASLWLKCQEELNDTEAIRQNYKWLFRYNLSYDNTNEEVGVTNAKELADSKEQQQLLEECRAILEPILKSYNAEKKAKQEELAAKEAKAKKKEEVRQRRAVIWTALLAGLGQALQNMGTAYANSLNTGGKSSAGVSSVGGGASVSSPSSSSSSSSSSNSSSSSQPKEVHEKCRVCDGSGIIYDSRIKGPDVKKKCPACDGRGYKIRYTSK